VAARSLAVAFAAGLALFLGACGYTPSALDSWPEKPSCGRWENRNEPVSADQRGKNHCILGALADGRRAELIVTYHTIEGDPITEYYRVLSPGRVESFVDSTRDSYGSRKWAHFLCRGIGEDGGYLFGENCREIPVDERVS